MRQFTPNGALEFTVYGADLMTATKAPRYRAEPDTASSEGLAEVFLALPGGGRGVRFSGRLSRADELDTAPSPLPVEQRVEREREITALSLFDSFVEDISLKTGSLHEPMEALRTCVDELIGHWGIDVAAHRTLSQAAEPRDLQNLGRTIQSRYPSKMIRLDQQATVRVRLMIDATGKPDECHIQSAVGHEEFEETVCNELMRKGRFNPGLDAQGQPLRSFWTTLIDFRLH